MNKQVLLEKFVFRSFWLRIGTNYSDLDPAKRFGSFRIWIHNTALRAFNVHRAVVLRRFHFSSGSKRESGSSSFLIFGTGEEQEFGMETMIGIGNK